MDVGEIDVEFAEDSSNVKPYEVDAKITKPHQSSLKTVKVSAENNIDEDEEKSLLLPQNIDTHEDIGI